MDSTSESSYLKRDSTLFAFIISACCWSVLSTSDRLLFDIPRLFCFFFVFFFVFNGEHTAAIHAKIVSARYLDLSLLTILAMVIKSFSSPSGSLVSTPRNDRFSLSAIRRHGRYLRAFHDTV